MTVVRIGMQLLSMGRPVLDAYFALSDETSPAGMGGGPGV